MKELVVLSGKGGTGKTTVAASLFALAAAEGLIVATADCDVDAANLYLLLDPHDGVDCPYTGGAVAEVDMDACTRCGICVAKCLFGAMKAPGKVDPSACEGCGVCALVCPGRAVKLVEEVSGTVHRGLTTWGETVWAHLLPGRGNSGKLVAAVRKLALARSSEAKAALLIADGPPGIGCPVISSVTGSDYALLVTEPSVSGHHDLTRIVDLCRHFGVPHGVVINKADLAPEIAEETVAWCQAEQLPVLGRIPFDQAVPESIAASLPLVAAPWAGRSPAAKALGALWARLRSPAILG